LFSFHVPHFVQKSILKDFIVLPQILKMISRLFKPLDHGPLIGKKIEKQAGAELCQAQF
jgi:hypothetical protein